MPDLGFTVQGMKDTNYITPRIGTTPGQTGGLAASDPLREDNATNEARQQAMTANLFNSKYGEDPSEGALSRIAKYTAAAGVDMADMVVGSTPFADRGAVWKEARNMGLYGLADFADRNESGVQLTSGLVASVVTAGVADAYILPAIGGRLAASTYLSESKLWQLGAKALGGAKTLATDSAVTAALNGEMATVLGTTGGRALLKAKVAEGLARGAGQEAAVAAVTHSNQEMWSDDASTNMMMLGLGVGIGGALGGLGARYEMRQIANSDELQRVRSVASDPYGYTAVRAYQPDASEVKALGPTAQYKESTNATALALSARVEVPAGTPANRASLIEAEAKQSEIQAQRSVQKITSKGIEGAPNTRFSIDAPDTKAAGAHVTDALHNDPTVLFGIDSLGAGKLGENIDNRAKYVASLLESDKADDLRLARVLGDQEPLGLVGQSWMPDSSSLRQVADYEPGKITLTPTSKTAGHYEFKLDLKNGNNVKINEGGNVKNMASLDIDDQLRVYEGLNAVSQKMISNGQQFVLPANSTWLQKDFALNFKAKGGVVDLSQSGIKDMDSLQVASLFDKAGEAAKLKNGMGFWDRAKLNLPLPSSLERIHDGTSDMMVSLLNAVRKNPDMTLSDAKQIRNELLQAADLKKGIKTSDPAINGDMFNFNRSSETGKWQPVVTGYGSFERIQPELIGSREHLVVSTAENKIFRMQQLSNGIHSKELTENLLLAPEFQKSMSLTGLAADQVTGAGGGLDQGLGTFVTRSMRYRDSQVMMSALKVREAVDRASENYTNRVMTNVFQGKQNDLASIGNRGSKALVDQWLSFAGGWDLQKGAVADGTGMYRFELAQSARNEARLGRPVEAGDYLKSPMTGKDVVLDDTGLDFVERTQIASRQLLKDTNAVRQSAGLSPLQPKNWYVPPPTTKGKIVGFTFDADGKTVPGGAIVASSQEEFDALRAAKIKQLDSEGKGQRFRSESEIKATDDLWDLSEMGWVDPGFIGAKRTGQTGAIFGDKINPQATEDYLHWVTDRVKAVSNGTIRSIYDQQIAIARARSAAEIAVAGADAASKRTIYDEWEATILGRPLSSVKPGQGTAVIKSVEGLTQSVINSGWPLAKAIGATHVAQWTNDLTQRLGMKRVTGFKSFEQLSDQLADHTPYANAAQFVEANMRVSVPPEVKDIAASINRFSANMLLRWFEIPNAAMNMLGIVTNMPSILRSPGTPLMGTLVGSNGSKVGVVDSYKILAQGFRDMLSASKHPEWDTMIKNGDTTQSIAELNKQMSLIDSKSSFARVMGGDKTIKIGQGFTKDKQEILNRIKHKGVDGMISLATDTTESMSRSWAHFVGLRLADFNGIVGTEARHSFARDVANQAIANYNPLNKPELFQSSIGSMFGLFTSYMQQYNQRLFRWAETGDYTSICRQLAMQSTLFGVASAPGYNGLEWLFQGMGNNPDATLTDAIYAKYGPKVGAVIANGGISELPILLGLPTGISLSSRADANIRSPSLDPRQLMAGLNIVGQVAQGAFDIGSKMLDGGDGISARYITESLARNMPNRTIKGVIGQIFNDGQDVDASGQITSDTKDWMESSVRMLGLRSTRQQGEIEAYYANQSQRRRLAGRMETLREDTRATMRSGQPYDPMTLFNKYVEKGGSPSHFKTWIQEQMKATSDTRGMRQFTDSLKSPNSQLEAWRYDVRE